MYELGHIFANHDLFLFGLTYVTIILSSIVGPMIAMALYGANWMMANVEVWIQWVVTLSGKVKSRFGFDNKAFANSGLARSLEQRLLRPMV